MKMKKKKQKNITIADALDDRKRPLNSKRSKISKAKCVCYKKTKLSKLIKENSKAIEFLFEKGMYCVGCPASQDETVEEAAMAHGLNADELVKEINEKI